MVAHVREDEVGIYVELQLYGLVNGCRAAFWDQGMFLGVGEVCYGLGKGVGIRKN